MKDQRNEDRRRQPSGASMISNAKKLQALQQQVEELTQDLQRALADFANYQRRSTEEQAQLLQIAKEQVILQILPLLDNVRRALLHLPGELADHAWANGVKKVGEQARSTLASLGVEPIAAVGEAFNPELHEAVNFEDDSGEHEVVMEELQTGYKMGGRIIRPSMVKVGKVKGGKL